MSQKKNNGEDIWRRELDFELVNIEKEYISELETLLKVGLGTDIFEKLKHHLQPRPLAAVKIKDIISKISELKPTPKPDPIPVPAVRTKSKRVKLEVSQKECPQPMGIEGGVNSSYMDVSLMALYMFENVFFPSAEFAQVKDPEIWRTLANLVLNPLMTNKQLKISTGNMSTFRSQMGKFGRSYVSGQKKDPEMFLLTLFKSILSSQGLFTTDGRRGGWIFQLSPRPLNEPPHSTEFIDIQQLVDGTMADSKIKLDSLPFPGFIVKLPVTNNKPIYNHVLPNAELSLEGHVLENKARKKLTLSAVICLKDNHFTLFVRTSQEENALWLYNDSYQFGKSFTISGMNLLLKAMEQREHLTKALENYQFLRFMLRHAYICIYVGKTS